MTNWRVSAVDRVARVIVWCGRFAKGWLPRILGGIASLCFILWGVMGAAVWTSGAVWLWMGIGLGVLAFFAEFLVQRPSYMKLSQLRADAERRAEVKSEALERALRIMMTRLGAYCGLNGHSDRISVYYFHDGEFVMVARHSKNPSYASKGRGSYPADQGAIGAAWASEHGQALVSMPAAKEAWRRAARKQGFTDEAIDGLSMRSLGLAGHRLETGEKSVGVLILESANANRVEQSHLDTVAQSHIVAAIAELVAAFALMTPAGESVTAAKAERASGKWQIVSPRVGETASTATA